MQAHALPLLVAMLLLTAAVLVLTLLDSSLLRSLLAPLQVIARTALRILRTKSRSTHI